MLHADKILLALLLLRIYLRCGTKEPPYDEQFDHLLQRSDLLITGEAARQMQLSASKIKIDALNQDQIMALLRLSRLNEFKNCVNKIQSIPNLQEWLFSDKPEMNVIEISESSDGISKILEFLLCKIVLNFKRLQRRH